MTIPLCWLTADNWKLGVPSCPHTLLILIPLEAADMHSVHCKYGIPCFSTLHSHGNFSFQVTKVLSVTECFRFVELLSVFTAPFKISSMISVATILRKQVKSAPNQIGPKSNRPQIKSAPSQIGPSQIGPKSNRPHFCCLLLSICKVK